MKISKYIAKDNEANFAKPIKSQVIGGTHITFELITKKDDTFYMTRWPDGLPGHDDPPNALRFPHGLIRFGESLKDCASRLVNDQLGMKVKHVEVLYWDSYLDEHDHWHIEPGCLVEVQGKSKLPKGADKIISFRLANIPKMTFWSKTDFIETVQCKLDQT